MASENTRTIITEGLGGHLSRLLSQGDSIPNTSIASISLLNRKQLYVLSCIRSRRVIRVGGPYDSQTSQNDMELGTLQFSKGSDLVIGMASTGHCQV